ncbi:SAM-dependent methyltransferase [Azospirillum lipoferum]|uniref:Methyltransferase domain-containing protein n=1 Tax=Azospirillum lipoferum TaxID=193 RepID=A0A5A9GP68_AZOLI|nr:MULTISPECIES: methyltransferase domain-containing protein [Azospirillum]KAA0596258.1 methyltransferase domain-containing protein [Azospirillum lipoferum]MCP1611226.1 SAM-dependent methyltransferase [Azospirillum lipoferum]MDW5533649.1 methyltransferase domain-containing protein [Azospirillum sp. NL1]
MAEVDKAFAGAIPALYDRYLGPLIFEPYARDLAGRLVGVEGRILETAAGTGIVTRALVQTLPATIELVATDLNQPMLDHAARKLDTPQVTWRQANAMSLPFEDAGFDTVVCQFGVMFFPDKPAGFAEARRVLRPGGRFVFSVWDRIEDNEIAAVVSTAVAAAFPDDPPGFMARTPHGYHDKERIRDELRGAGFTGIEIETVPLRSRAASPADPATGFCQGTPMRLEIEARDASRLDEVTDLAAQAIARHFGDGPVDGKIQAHVITAVA